MPFLEADADPDPFVQFGRWFDDAVAAVAAPEAMALATAGPGGRPSVRMVLCKAWDRSGFVFHTDYRGRKARELSANPWAALLFHWEPLGRQVRVEGPVERLSTDQSDAYFATRPRGAQVAAHASAQSAVVADRAALDAQVAAARAHFAGGPVPRPEGWGGYRVVPAVWELWQSRADRLHDRLRYAPLDPAHRAWRIERLQP